MTPEFGGSAPRGHELTGYEEGLEYLGCAWSEEHQDACLFCAGEDCALCNRTFGDPPCPHDSFARHWAMPAGYREPITT